MKYLYVKQLFVFVVIIIQTMMEYTFIILYHLFYFIWNLKIYKGSVCQKINRFYDEIHPIELVYPNIIKTLRAKCKFYMNEEKEY